MPNNNVDSEPPEAENIPLSELCKVRELIAGTVTKNIHVFVERLLESPTAEDGVVQITFFTAIMLALFKAHGVPLDAPVLGPEFILPEIEEIANELGLRGCKATVLKGGVSNVGH